MSIDYKLAGLLSRRDQQWVTLYRIWVSEFRRRGYADPETAGKCYVQIWQESL